MGNHRQTIELNGKHYDIVTGRPMGPKPATHAKLPPTHIPVHHSTTRPAHPAKPAAHSIHARTAHSRTLMRSGVHKPHVTAASVAIDRQIETFSARKALEEQRLHRANKIPTSKLVAHFNDIDYESELSVPPHPADLKVKPEPSQYRHYKQPAEPKAHNSTHQRPAEPTPKPHNHFAAQLEHATAHTAKPLKKPKLRQRTAKKMHVKPATLNAGLAVVTLVILGGFFAYQNAAVLAVRADAARAGVAVIVPAHTPAGFHLQTHLAKPGEITLGYKSNSDDRSFKITQTASAWDTPTLFQNVVGNQSYQTIDSHGRVIFTYGNGAAWVDKGSLFKVEGDSGLSSSQLQQLVDSM